MADPITLTRQAYVERGRVRAKAVRYVRARWRQVDPEDLVASWNRHLPAVLAAVTTAQGHLAERAQETVTAVLAAQGMAQDPAGLVDPQAFTGRAADGRSLAPLLGYSTVLARHDIGQGMSPGQAIARAGRRLEALVATQLSDTSRQAAGVAVAARQDVAGYYRFLTPPSCERCAVLAGKWFKWNKGFERHPRCDCGHLPATEGSLDEDSRLWSPEQAFEKGMVKGLTEAETKAVEDGASMISVVNARRGRSADGLYTVEGTTRRGYASHVRRELDRQSGRATSETARSVGQRGAVRNYVERRTGPRPTPEAIYRYSSSRDEAIRLLHANGYISGDIRTIAARGRAA